MTVTRPEDAAMIPATAPSPPAASPRPTPRWARNAGLVLIGAAAAIFFSLGYARYRTFHNETFDLAFYGRLAWGFAHMEGWEPIVGAHWLGLHISPVLVPLGLLGLLFDTPTVLLATQGMALAAAAWPLGRIAGRRFGALGQLVAITAWLLHPNLAHVAGFEFHVGSLAVVPLAWAVDALDRGHAKHLAMAVVGVLCCREDLALLTMMLGLLAWADGRRATSSPAGSSWCLGRTGGLIALFSLAYLLLFFLVLHPLFAPAHGSMDLHFGKWGAGLIGAVLGALGQPAALWAHVIAAERLWYLPAMLLPLAFLPVVSPRYLLIAMPVVAMNLLSDFPGTATIESHYLTPALPAFFAAAILGAERVCRPIPRLRRAVLIALGAAALGTHVCTGGTPLSISFDGRAFAPDERSHAAARIVAAVRDGESVQAPYALMAHLAERRRIQAAPPPERVTDVVILDAGHRQRLAHSEDLLRLDEEPVVRGWLARTDHGLVAAEPPYLMLRRGADPWGPIASAYVVRRGARSEGIARHRLSACLALIDVELLRDHARFDFVALGTCPSDLAMRFGPPNRHSARLPVGRPDRVDLLCDGLVSPAKLRRGDVIRSTHELSAAEAAAIRAHGMRIGLLRESGAPPEPSDPLAIDLSPAEL